jgi:hypothetical protein
MLLCHTVYCCVTLCTVVSHCVMLCHAVYCCVTLCTVVSRCILLCHAVYCCVTLYAVQNDLNLLFCTILLVQKENYGKVAFASGRGKRELVYTAVQ